MVNLIADHALLVGFTHQTRFIDSQIIEHAIEKHLPTFEATVVQLDDVLTGNRDQIAQRAGLEQSQIVICENLTPPAQTEVNHG